VIVTLTHSAGSHFRVILLTCISLQHEFGLCLLLLLIKVQSLLIELRNRWDNSSSIIRDEGCTCSRFMHLMIFVFNQILQFAATIKWYEYFPCCL
jgi:hypothetical protein